MEELVYENETFKLYKGGTVKVVSPLESGKCLVDVSYDVQHMLDAVRHHDLKVEFSKEFFEDMFHLAMQNQVTVSGVEYNSDDLTKCNKYTFSKREKS